ncbi:MAG: alpha-E domain-containing protein [Ferruginibacter sp.]
MIQGANFAVFNPLNNLITSMVAFMGLNRESISREQGWIMLDAGRKVEQSVLLVNMLLSTIVNKYNEAVEYNLQESVLVSSESLVNYRYKYRAHIQLGLVLDLMLFDGNNPRSLMYQLNHLKNYLESLPKSNGETYLEHDRLLYELFELLKLAHKDQLVVPDNRRKKYKNLELFLLSINSLLQAIPEAISKVYFEHAQEQKQLFS